VLRADLHIHTIYSDGKIGLEQLIKEAEKRLDVISITDHDTISGYERALKVVKKLGSDLLIVPGIEISHKKGHILVYGVNDKIIENLKEKNIDEIVKTVHSLKGIVVAAHPFGGFRRPGFCDEMVLKKFDGIEVLNGMCMPDSNKAALKIAKKLKLPMISGSDAHFIDDVGKFAFKIKCEKNISSILNAIKEGKTILPKIKTDLISVFFRKFRKFYHKEISY